jgi:hypothetical protein
VFRFSAIERHSLIWQRAALRRAEAQSGLPWDEMGVVAVLIHYNEPWQPSVDPVRRPHRHGMHPTEMLERELGLPAK